MQTTTTRKILLTDAESFALYRAVLEYRRTLELARHAPRGHIVDREIANLDAAAEKISLAAYYPAENGCGGDNA